MSAFIDERREDFGVEPICRILECRRPPTTTVITASGRLEPQRMSG